MLVCEGSKIKVGSGCALDPRTASVLGVILTISRRIASGDRSPCGDLAPYRTQSSPGAWVSGLTPCCLRLNSICTDISYQQGRREKTSSVSPHPER